MAGLAIISGRGIPKYSNGDPRAAKMCIFEESLLHVASRHARVCEVKELLQHHADPNARDTTGRTPLHAAVAVGCREVVHTLLQHPKTRVNLKAFDGASPLILAARLPVTGIVELLTEAKANIHLKDNKGNTALHWAASVNNVDAVRLLCHCTRKCVKFCHCTSKNDTNGRGETPLFLSCREGYYDAAFALLDCCSDQSISDQFDKLPLDIAFERAHHKIVQLLSAKKQEQAYKTQLVSAQGKK